MVKNCSTGVVDLWNATLYDRPELKLTGNLTGITEDAESICIEILQLISKTGKPLMAQARAAVMTTIRE